MKSNTERIGQITQLLAEEVNGQLQGQPGIEQLEQKMRELVKTAAGLGMQQALEQREGGCPKQSMPCNCEGIVLAVTFLFLIYGSIRGKNKIIKTLTLTWVVPFSLYLFIFIAIKPFHFYLPIALPLYASLGNLIPELKIESLKGAVKNNQSRLMSVVSVIVLLLLGVQFVLNLGSSFEAYQYHLNREKTNPAIAFFSSLEEEYLSQISDDVQLRVIHDRSVYMPVSARRWKTQVIFNIINYDDIQGKDLLVFSRQRIIDYLQPDTLDKAEDKEDMLKTQELYRDIVEGQVEGYILFYQNDFGIAFIKEDLFLENFE